MVVIGLLVWPVGVSKNKKKIEHKKVTENALPTQTPFPLSHINQILHVGSYPGYLSWFWVSLKSAENVGAVGGRNFGLPIDLAHRLYNSLLLRHNGDLMVGTPQQQLGFLFSKTQVAFMYDYKYRVEWTLLERSGFVLPTSIKEKNVW